MHFTSTLILSTLMVLSSTAWGSSLFSYPDMNLELNGDTIPFVVTPSGNIAIECILDEKDTLLLMYHTAHGDISLSPETTERLSRIHSSGEINSHSWGGEFESEYSIGHSARIASIVQDSVTVWKNSLTGHGTDGKFGPDFFSAYSIEVNFSNRYLVLHSPDFQPSEDFISIHIEYRKGSYFLPLSLKVDEKEMSHSFLLHSGYTGGLLVDDIFAQTHGLSSSITNLERVDLKDSAGATVTTYKGKLPILYVGEYELEDMSLSFFSGALGRQKMSVVGCEVLSKFDFIISSDATQSWWKWSDMNADG